MLPNTPLRRHARVFRWLSPPWSDDHPDWLRLDAALSPSHRARLIARIVDLFVLDPWLPLLCAGFGSEAHHPRLLLKLVLHELDEGILSPAQWFRDSTEKQPLQWLLHGATPSRAVLYDFRKRLPASVLEELNRQILQTAQEEGHCPGKRASIDGTFIAALGSRHQMLNNTRLSKRLQLIEEAVAADERGEKVNRRPRWMATTAAGRLRQRQRLFKADRHLREKLKRHKQRQARIAKKKRCPEKAVTVCLREPEAVIGRDKTKVVRPLYNTQVLRDLDSPFLLGYGVFASATDAGLLPLMLERTQRLTGKLPEQLLGDGIYSSVKDLRSCKDKGIVLYAPVDPEAGAGKEKSTRQALPLVEASPETKEASEAQAEAKEKKQAYIDKQHFKWDEATRSYTCPAGQRMERISKTKDKRGEDDFVEMETYATKACAGCSKRPECTRSKHGRRIKRMVEEPLVEELRQRMASAEGKELYKLRKQTIELVFADWKAHRGMHQFRGFGLAQAEVQIGLLVLLHNAKTLLQQRQAAKEAA